MDRIVRFFQRKQPQLSSQESLAPQTRTPWNRVEIGSWPTAPEEWLHEQHITTPLKTKRCQWTSSATFFADPTTSLITTLHENALALTQRLENLFNMYWRLQ